MLNEFVVFLQNIYKGLYRALAENDLIGQWPKRAIRQTVFVNMTISLDAY
jgi:hypothetical protein